MKIIGEGAGGVYLAEVTKEEIEKYFNLYYNKSPKDMMKIGSVIDLGKGYNHAQEIAYAMDQTQRFIASNRAVVDAIMNGLTVVSRMDPLAEGQ